MLVFVNRPVMATAINLVLVIIGLIALKQLPLRHHTHSAELAVMVQTHYAGANSAVIEQRITKPLENALSGIDGLRHTTSKSYDGFSDIHIRFRKNYSAQRALNEVRDRVQATMPQLPKEVEPPRIYERGANEEDLMYLAFQDPTRSNAEVFDFILRNVLEQLKLIEGVAEVGDFGGTPYVIQLRVDPAELIHYELSLNDLVNTLRAEKTFASGGQIQALTGKKTIVIEAPFDTPEAVAEIPLVTRDNKVVRVKDVAEVVLDVENYDFSMRVDGLNTVGLFIKAKVQANPMDVSTHVHKFIKKLKPTLPESMEVSVLFDRTKTFKAGLDAIYRSLWEAVILVGVIVTLSLASVRAAVVPMITVPLCLISAFTLMWLFNFSINPVTLLAMVLAVGLVVDDAIVVVENIHRHMESGLSALDAARKGMKEITFAVIVMTLTLVAVYMPVAFQVDSSAAVFKEFAWTLAGSVLISGFVALTLTPAMCGRWLSGTALVDKNSKAERFWTWLNNKYQWLLGGVMKKSFWVVALAIAIFAASLWIFQKLPSEFQPFEDEDHLFGWMSAETEVTPEIKESWDEQLETVVAANVPEATRLMLGTWRDNYWWVVYLLPRAERDEDAQTIAKRLEAPLKDIAGPMIGVNLAASGSTESNNLEVVVRYSGDSHLLLNRMQTIVDELEKVDGITRVDSKEIKLKNRYHVKVLREVAASLGIHVDAIEDVLYTFFSGKKAAEITFDGFDYDVVVTATEDVRSELSGVNQFFVKRPNGVSVPLGTLVEIEEVLEPEFIKHYEQIRSAKLDIYLGSDFTIEEALQATKPIIKKHLPADALVTFSGAAEKYQEAKRAMWITLGLALAFIYLILAALFESLIDPFIVLLTVPLSILGAVLAIYLTGGTNNIYMQMGIVTLIGLITKHGILITDFANRLLAEGHTIVDAVRGAAVARLRPILMTTMAMIFGAIPLVYSVGAGAHARQHLGWVIIGGMLSGTFFSLFVIPVIFALFAHLRKRFASPKIESSAEPKGLS